MQSKQELFQSKVHPCGGVFPTICLVNTGLSCLNPVPSYALSHCLQQQKADKSPTSVSQQNRRKPPSLERSLVLSESSLIAWRTFRSGTH